MSQYFYSGQIRRFLAQFIRMLSGFQVEFGQDRAGNTTLQRVPIYYGDGSRQVAAIINNMSENAMPTVPAMTVYINNVTYDRDRVQQPDFVGKMNIRQRYYNEDTQEYEARQGNAFSIERLMPVPYTLELKLDIWTSNTEQKLQIWEQIVVFFNPSFEIQTTDNYIDWTSLSVVYQDGITFTSRSIPQGTGNPIDVLSWKFYMPIWISNAAKLKKMGVIEKIIASIFSGKALDDIQNDDLLLGTRQKITPYGYKLLLIGNSLQLLPANQDFYPSNEDLDLPPNPNTSLYWSSLLNVYGTIRPGISQIWLQNPFMDTEIVGTIVLDPIDDRLLIYDIDSDTLPQNTLDPVDSVINPLVTGPNAGLPAAVNGVRYLIVDNIGHEGDTTIAWGNVVAYANDIIEYDSDEGEWVVSFDSAQATTVEYVTNLTTSIQYRYVDTDGVWMKSWEGWYDQGDYSIVI